MTRNKNKKANEADDYFFCTHVTSDGYQYELLLTKREFDVGVKRAETNPEDVPENYIVLQGYRKACNDTKS
jgi:hypothetical protein